MSQRQINVLQNMANMLTQQIQLMENERQALIDTADTDNNCIQCAINAIDKLLIEKKRFRDTKLKRIELLNTKLTQMNNEKTQARETHGDNVGNILDKYITS